MKRRYVLSPQATHDLVAIWRYLQKETSVEVANRVESVIRQKFGYLATFPNAGHLRRDLTSAQVRFFPFNRIRSSIVPGPNRWRL